MYQFLEQTVAGHMTRTVKTVTRGLTMRELGEMFERDDFNAYPVEDDGQMVGLVTKFDLLKCFAFTPNQMVPRYDDLMQRTVADVMTSEFIYVRSDTKTDAGAAIDGRTSFPQRSRDRHRPPAGRHDLARRRDVARCKGWRYHRLVNGRSRRPAVRAGKRPQFALARSSSSGAIR